MPIKTFKTRKGDILAGRLIHSYSAFEGGMRYIISVEGKEYRCVKDGEGRLIEFVA